MLSSKAVDFFAHQSGIRAREIAEREIVLTYALRMLAESGYLDRLAFKGGTCIRKVWIGPTGRFSMDLDFTAREEMEPAEAILDLMEVFNQEFHGIQFELENNWRITQNGLSFTTHPSYRHEWTQNGGFDLQVSLREQPTLDVEGKAQIPQRYFKDLEFDPPEIPSIEEHEIVAEKVRAAYQRAKVRDLHDLFVYATRPLDRELLRRLVVIKLWQVHDIFDPEDLVARIQEGHYDWNDLGRLVRSTTRIEPEQIIERIVSRYAFLSDLTEEESALAVDAKAHRATDLWHEMSESCRRRKQTGEF